MRRPRDLGFSKFFFSHHESDQPEEVWLQSLRSALHQSCSRAPNLLRLLDCLIAIPNQSQDNAICPEPTPWSLGNFHQLKTLRFQFRSNIQDEQLAKRPNSQASSSSSREAEWHTKRPAQWFRQLQALFFYHRGIRKYFPLLPQHNRLLAHYSRPCLPLLYATASTHLFPPLQHILPLRRPRRRRGALF